MPIYDYICPKCKKTKEVLFFNKEELEVPVCKECELEMERILGTCSFSLKGEGFYKKGFSGSNKKKKRRKKC